jgi:DNA helicase II / ATP-dependent DNA helicase PcrA
MTGLNEQQLDAVTTSTGPLLILAGAGSGKTRVITHRVAYLIEKCGVRPWQVLAVTFTNKAAAEMKARVSKLLEGYYSSEPQTGAPLISTFHALCVRILRRDIEKLKRGYTRSFTIYDTDDQLSTIRKAIKNLGLDEKQIGARAAQSRISAAKNRGQSPRDFAVSVESSGDQQQIIARLYEAYENQLLTSNALDFDDLLIRTVQLLRQSPETRNYYHERFRHVMVDEFQDTNGIQYSLARLIVEGEKDWHNRSLCVVGDESQSIYGWRGSDFKIILGFQQDFPGTKVIKLEENYRSTRRILAAANRVISNNKQRFDKELRSSAGEGEKIGYSQLYDGEGEARWIVERIREHMRREPAARVAVLYRTNAQSRLFEEACRRNGIRYNLVGGFSFYERAEVKDVVAYLKLALNPNDDVALMRVINTPVRGIGKTTTEEIERRAKDYGISNWETIGKIIDEPQGFTARATGSLRAFRQIISGLVERTAREGEPVADIVKAAIIDTGYERALKTENTEEAEARLLNLEELVNAAAESDEQGEGIRDFLDHAALASDTDDYNAAAQVTLMTMHSAKGLEFPVVFIAGLEEGLFPHSRGSESEAELEEERRLCYVAITRAERFLYLSHAFKRRVYGDEMISEPSRFLMEFPLDLIENQSTGPSWLGFADPSRMQAPAASPQRRSSNYQGRAYNDVAGVGEFLRQRGKQQVEENRNTAPAEFKPGTRVRHAKYGQGLVVGREGEGEMAKLTITFPGYGTKKIIEKFASLERV